MSVSGFYNEMVEVLALQDGDAARLAVGRTLIWREPEAGDAPVPAAAATLANALQTWYLGQDARSLLRSPEALPGWLLSLAVTVAARHAADLGRDVLDGLLGACKEAETPIARERAGALVVWLPELLRELDPGAVGEVGAVSIALAALIPDRDGRKVREWLPPDLRMEVADTPEGRAMRELPPDVARRVIPELAVSLASRWRGTVNP